VVPLGTTSPDLSGVSSDVFIDKLPKVDTTIGNGNINKEEKDEEINQKFDEESDELNEEFAEEEDEDKNTDSDEDDKSKLSQEKNLNSECIDINESISNVIYEVPDAEIILINNNTENLNKIDIEKENEYEEIKSIKNEKKDENLQIDLNTNNKLTNENNQKLEINLIENKDDVPWSIVANRNKIKNTCDQKIKNTNGNMFTNIILSNRYELLGNEPSEEIEEYKTEKEKEKEKENDNKNNKIIKSINLGNEIPLEVKDIKFGYEELNEIVRINEVLEDQIWNRTFFFLIFISNLLSRRIIDPENILNELTNLDFNYFNNSDFIKLRSFICLLTFDLFFEKKIEKNPKKLIKQNWKISSNEENYDGLSQLLDLLENPDFYNQFWNYAYYYLVSISEVIQELNGIETKPVLLRMKKLDQSTPENLDLLILWEMLCMMDLETYLEERTIYVARKIFRGKRTLES